MKKHFTKPTRSNLQALEGKLVAFTGWETGSRHNQTWICVSKPYVRIWDKNESVQEAVKKKGGYYFDHLWLTGDNRSVESQDLEMFGKIGGVGVVRRYERKNGTFDFTVMSPDNRYQIEEFIDIYNEGFEERSQKERLKMLQDAITMIEAHESGSDNIVFGMSKSVSEFKQEMLQQELEIKRSVAATEKALKTATMNGKCKAINLLTLNNKKTAKPKGF